MNLKELRQAQNLSQRQVAEALDVTKQTISNWETGQYEPLLKIHQVVVLCQLYQCSLTELAEATSETQTTTQRRRRTRSKTE